MGLTTHALSFLSGVYIGLYLSKNYNVPNVPNPDEIHNYIKKWLEENKKDKGDKWSLKKIVKLAIWRKKKMWNQRFDKKK